MKNQKDFDILRKFLTRITDDNLSVREITNNDIWMFVEEYREDEEMEEI